MEFSLSSAMLPLSTFFATFLTSDGWDKESPS